MRREFPSKVKAAAFLRAAGKCERCGFRLTVGKVRYDHAIADGLTGEPTIENCAVLCVGCHAEKTALQDVPAIARAKRREARHIGAKPKSRNPIPGSRNTKWRRRMDGTTERRT